MQDSNCQGDVTSLLIFPNPTEGELTVALSNVLSGSLNISDVTGQIINSQVFDDITELLLVP